MSEQLNELRKIYTLLPSGILDSKALEKMHRERQEFEETDPSDRLGRVMEAADWGVYYAHKAYINGRLSIEECDDEMKTAAAAVGLTVDKLVAVCLAKYRLRARKGNPKNDQEERKAVEELIKINP